MPKIFHLFKFVIALFYFPKILMFIFYYELIFSVIKFI